MTTSHQSVSSSLIAIGAISDENIERFSDRTRDREGLEVLRDNKTGVIFIDHYYVGVETYTSGSYRGNGFSPRMQLLSYEDHNDAQRRFTSYQRLFCGLTLCDFGCGAGNFLRLAKSLCKAVHGIELQDNFVQQMQNDGISCSKVFPEQATYDVVTLFHVLEHLPDFRGELRKIYARLKDGGCVVVEVPHARDFLLDRLCSEKFKQFTLWSQHLVLHVRDSLRRALMDVGFKNVQIEGVQRYGISNHMGWLANGLPGGHKSSLSCLETPELVAAYAMAMSKIDANDTLVAIATK